MASLQRYNCSDSLLYKPFNAIIRQNLLFLILPLLILNILILLLIKLINLNNNAFPVFFFVRQELLINDIL